MRAAISDKGLELSLRLYQENVCCYDRPEEYPAQQSSDKFRQEAIRPLEASGELSTRRSFRFAGRGLKSWIRQQLS
jgi:hypothetical protein